MQPELAHQIALYGQERGRSHAIHKRHFQKLSTSLDFTGNINPGTAIKSVSQSLHNETFTNPEANNTDNNDDEDDADDEDDDDEHIAEDIICALLEIAYDNDRDIVDN